ncbi:MAG: lipopolysaccharide heptosyltransferase II [Verrucomicrobia bacterium]|nr:MAG: lipopolysaccharide heptosyltransferase II [Verrucomicrobiota bacterium]
MNEQPGQGHSAAKKILVRGVNWLGDAVMSTPALQRLREARADAEITLLTPFKLADLWRHHPSVDRLITFAQGENVWKVAARLRRENFQTAVVFPNSLRSALEVWLARVPWRVGYCRSWRNILLTQPLPPRAGAVKMRKRSTSEINARISQGTSAAAYPISAHHIYDYLNLVSALGAKPEPLTPALHVTANEVEEVEAAFTSGIRNKLGDIGLRKPSVWCGLNAGAEFGPAKRWPKENFVAAAKEISRVTDCLWLIFGGPKDFWLGNEIARGIGGGVKNLAGKTSLRELMLLLKSCRVLLTNDTGPMHVAAALGTPVVVPFGSTSPELTGPGSRGETRNALLSAHVPCSPCFRRECPIDFRCMRNISIEEVVEAVLRMLRR